MNFRMKVIFLGTVIVLLNSGCSIQQSGNIRTSGIRATYTITGDSRSGATASAQFTEKDTGVGITYIQLSDGDEVTVNGMAMDEAHPFEISYESDVPLQVGGSYTFTFTRPGESPYVATVTLPDLVTITSPADGSTLNRGQAITMTWPVGANPSETMIAAMTTNGDTVGGYFTQTLLPDLGTATIGASYTTTAPSGTHAPSGPTPPTIADLSVKRERAGTMPSGLSGSISAVQKAEASVGLH